MPFWHARVLIAARNDAAAGRPIRAFFSVTRNAALDWLRHRKVVPIVPLDDPSIRASSTSHLSPKIRWMRSRFNVAQLCETTSHQRERVFESIAQIASLIETHEHEIWDVTIRPSRAAPCTASGAETIRCRRAMLRARRPRVRAAQAADRRRHS